MEVASRGVSKIHIEPYNRGPISPRKQGEGRVEVVSRGNGASLLYSVRLF